VIDTITPEEVRAAAARYFVPENSVTVTLSRAKEAP
jgi:predicted Zn-dependent peptidase